MFRCLFAAFAAVSVLLAPDAATAQDQLERELRLFLDCTDFRCDDDYFIEAIPWTDFVRDREAADVHVLATRERTGGGGAAYTFEFIGRGPFADWSTALTLNLSADATDDEERRAFARLVRLGVAPLAAQTTAAGALDVSYEAEAEDVEVASAPADDPWDFWTFRLNANSFFNGESSYSNLNGFGSVSASRVTAGWKHSLSLNGSYSRDEFEIDDSTTVLSSRESYGFNTLNVRSISDHWSVGASTGLSRSTYNNYDSRIGISPAIEYSVYPYQESNRRLLLILYTIGPRHFDYAQETLFGQTAETLLEHTLSATYEVTQPWGSVDASSSASHFIGSLDGDSEWLEPQYRLGLGGGVDVRLLKGLSVRLDGNASLIRNQIQLPGGDLTDEEILTRQRELATNFRYWGSFGLSYTFGSIYSSVVNPRFEYFD